MTNIAIYGIMILLTISAGAAFAQESLISVKTDDSHYDEGDTIVVSGAVTTVISNTPVTMQIHLDGTIKDIAQIVVAQDGSYSHTILAEGAYWNERGDYTIRVLYGSGNSAEAQFTYSPITVVVPTTDSFEVDAGNYGTFDVEYTIVGGAVDHMEVDSENLGVLVQIRTTDDEGSITLSLPREFIGAQKEDRSDEEYIVLIDGIPTSYTESTGQSGSRVIKMNFQDGDSDVLIIGTYVVPEFGTSEIAMIILGAGIIAVVLVARNKFQARLEIQKSTFP